MRNFRRFALAVLAPLCAFGQMPPEPLHIGPGVMPPRLIHKQEPEYSPLARRDLIQGSVVFSLVINERGLPTNIEVISPLGFGLDEKAEEAIRKWRFAPGMKEGKPVPVIAQIEVNFRFPSIWFDEKAERRRTSFNLALKNLAAVNQDTRNGAVETVQKLAAEKLPAAMYLAGRWEARGENGVAKNEAVGWALIEKAAQERYGPAMYEVAMRTINAGADPAEMDAQQQEVRDAAVLGSTQAQYYLGEVYETGKGVPADLERARRYFRLCATKGIPLCRYRLGRRLVDDFPPGNDSHLQGIAWLELASDRNIPEAKVILGHEEPALSQAQTAMVNTWKNQLLQMRASR